MTDRLLKAKPTLFGLTEQELLDKNKYKGAYVYARADRSDPFALARAMAHVRNGVASSSDYGADISESGVVTGVHRL